MGFALQERAIIGLARGEPVHAYLATLNTELVFAKAQPVFLGVTPGLAPLSLQNAPIATELTDMGVESGIVQVIHGRPLSGEPGVELGFGQAQPILTGVIDS